MAAQKSGGQLLAGIVLGFLVAAALALGVRLSSGADANRGRSRASSPLPPGATLPGQTLPSTLERPPRDPAAIAPTQRRSLQDEFRRQRRNDAGER